MRTSTTSNSAAGQEPLTKQMSDFLEYLQSSPLYDTVVVRTFMQASADQVQGRSHGSDGMLVSYKIK